MNNYDVFQYVIEKFLQFVTETFYCQWV